MNRRCIVWVGLHLLFLCALPTVATATQALSAAQETRAKALFSRLHCVVCEGQSLAGSDARLARDIRNVVRDKIADGEPDDAITAYLVERYGERVLMEPPLRASTLPLWGAPLLFMALAFAIAWRRIFRTGKVSP